MKTGIVAGIVLVLVVALVLRFRGQGGLNKSQTTERDNKPSEDRSQSTLLYSASPKTPSDVFKEGIRSAGSPYGEANPSSGLLWIEATNNRFGIRVLDCRSVTHDMVSTTGDPNIAATFTQLRNSDGQQYRGSIPNQSLHTDSVLTYPPLRVANHSRLFVAQQMEDKWDIYLWDGHLYFSRSWTGDLIFRAKVDFSDHATVVSSIDAKSQMVKGDGSLAVREVDFLIKSHLFKQEVPHPLPPDQPSDAQQIAMHSFALFGRWASYATYEDTTKSRLIIGQ